MASRKILLITALLCLFSSEVFSQGATWKNFTNMKEISGFVQAPGTNDLYCASTGGLFTVDMQTGAVTRQFTNIDGLIINDLLSIGLDNLNRLWIGASDGSISIYDYSQDRWEYIFDIRNSNEADKSINDFLLYNGFMYVATGYGIQKIRTSDLTFVDAPYSQLGFFPANTTKVLKLALYSNKLFAATEVGIAYSIDINGNLNNPSSWINYNDVPFDTDILAAEPFDNKIFFGSPDGIRYFDGTSWFVYPNITVTTGSVTALKSIGDRLYMALNNQVYYSTASDLTTINQVQGGANYTVIEEGNNSDPIYGTSGQGIFLNVNSSYTFVAPNGPNTNSFVDIAFDESGTLWAGGGAVQGGFYKYDGVSWTNYNTSNTSGIGTSNDFRSLVPHEGKVWALSFGGGATLLENSTFTNFNTTNSILPGNVPGSPFCVPTAGAYDLNGIFWTAFWVVEGNQSLFAYKPDGTWQGVTVSAISTNNNGFAKMVVDDFNTKWFNSTVNANRLYYYNDRGTLGTTSDDISGFYSANEFGSDINNLNDVIIDENDEVWVATNNGVFIISSPQSVLNGQKPTPRKLGIISGNLIVPFTEASESIGVDVLNNKWIGTANNGIFHLSEDGTTLIEQFNVSNSPILSNQITSVAVNSIDGIAYFGTSNGLSSVTTNAIKPLAEFGDIVCSPNPFLLPSSVDLRIDGLIANSTIKIITLTGEVITEFDSPGGKIATWDNSRNLTLASGIYIVVAFNSDGSQVGKGKFAVVRK